MKSRFIFPALALLFNSPVLAHETNSFYLEQALVHHVKPAKTTAKFPVIMVPGHNLSSYIYLTTPDGRDGWAQQFADAGYEVFVINDPKFDFSRGFDVEGFSAPDQGAPPANANATQAWGQDIWRRWGFGTSEGNPYPDSKFPTDDFDNFKANYPWLTSGATTSFSNAITALLKPNGPAILMAHSAGGPQAVAAAKTHPDLTAGIILIEPTGPPTAADFPTLKGISLLGVYADYIDSRRQGSRKTATIAAADLFEKNGGSGEIIDLVEDYGVRGNSHLMMQATNNKFISDLIIEWADGHAKVPSDPGEPDGGGGAGGGKGGKGGGMKGGGKGGKGGGKGRGGMVTQIMTQLDTDKDGALDESEFKKGRRYRNADAETVKKAFEAADKDGDGKVTDDELGGAGGKGGKGGGRKGRG
ncbi:MAG: hypothetical protein HKN23_08100 [Verrucomicrobiales bacterium]|nr:hypothetical protein [Verrucomicrobiales bacterium]